MTSATSRPTGRPESSDQPNLGGEWSVFLRNVPSVVVLALVMAISLATFSERAESPAFISAAALTLGSLACSFATPWARLPAWCAMVPALMLIAAIGALTAIGFRVSIVALIPLIDLARHHGRRGSGRRRDHDGIARLQQVDVIQRSAVQRSMASQRKVADGSEHFGTGEVSQAVAVENLIADSLMDGHRPVGPKSRDLHVGEGLALRARLLGRRRKRRGYSGRGGGRGTGARRRARCGCFCRRGRLGIGAAPGEREDRDDGEHRGPSPGLRGRGDETRSYPHSCSTT